MRDPGYFGHFSFHHVMTSVFKVAPQEGPVTQPELVNSHNKTLSITEAVVECLILNQLLYV